MHTNAYIHYIPTDISNWAMHSTLMGPISIPTFCPDITRNWANRATRLQTARSPIGCVC